jgi:hypothetical protein
VVNDIHSVEALSWALAEALRRNWDASTIRAYAMQHTWQAVAARVVGQWELAVRLPTVPTSPDLKEQVRTLPARSDRAASAEKCKAPAQT